MTTYILALDRLILNIHDTVYTAITRSVSYYLSSLLKVQGSATLITNDDITALYNVGLGEPVTVTSAVLHYYLNLLNPSSKAPTAVETTKEALRQLKRLQSSVSKTSLSELRDLADISAFVAQIQARGGGKAGLAQVLPPTHPYLFANGDLDSGNVVARLFEEQYLGVSHFSRIYRKPVLTQRGPGYLDIEVPMMAPSAIGAYLKPDDQVGVFTTRPLAPVQWVLERQGISGFFPIVVTGENITAEEARARRRTGEEVSLLPPHSYLIEETLANLQIPTDTPVLFISPLDADHAAAKVVAGANWSFQKTWSNT